MRRPLSNIRLSAKQKRELKKLARRPDCEMDCSGIPELTEKSWRNAVRNPFYRPVKKQLTLRLDADAIAWLRRQGKGYQTRANALLRAAMLEDVEGAGEASPAPATEKDRDDRTKSAQPRMGVPHENGKE
jgi:uncharacterized protein (DUF4415 family)